VLLEDLDGKKFWGLASFTVKAGFGGSIDV
jgi:hypothetical protein